MIKLHKITLKNFKSFQRASIPFADGFTAIAGANGTGKSNILDATMFALGITSLKMLRANKLIDLVNSGAEENYAKVVLELAKDGKTFEVSRTIDRQGRSVFGLNGKRSALNEISNLLAELGVRADGYNIVVQGDITKIIEMSPKERRAIIEDVSGIREFDEKRQEALKNLEKVEAKVKDSRIVLAERENYLQKLAEEKELASKYSNLQEELKKSKATLVAIELHKTRSELNKFREEEKKLAEELSAHAEKNAALTKEFTEMGNKLEELNQKLLEGAEKTFEGLGKDIEEKKAEIRVMEEKIKSKQNIASWSKNKINSISFERSVLQEKEKEKSQRIEELEAEADSERKLLSKSPLHSIEQRLENSIKEHALLKGEEGSIKKALEQLKKAKAACPTCGTSLGESKKQKILEQREERAGKISGEKKTMEEQINSLKKAVEETKEAQDKIAELEMQKSRQEFEMQAMKERISSSKKETADLEKTVQESEQETDKANSEMQAQKEQLKKLEFEYRKSQQANQETVQQKDFLKKKLEEAGEKKAKAEDSLRKTEQKLNTLRLDSSKSEVRLADLEEENKQFEGTKLIAAADPETLKKRLPQIEKEILAMGAINMKALQHFEEYQKEVEEVNGKVQKLEEERIAVLQLIESIEKRRMEVFSKCLEEINRNFSKIFHLFFGGEGRLSVTQGNIEEAGLLIEAKYKGEKLKGLELLSGGEKSLTALAFLFAIQLYQPSPFYVFDEADAALDKENSGKMANVIKEICKQSQFIAITHNDVLVREADQIIGVTLNKNKSSVVGLKLREQLLKEGAIA